MPTLGIDPDKVCAFIARVRQFQAKVAPVEPDPASNMSDDGFREILEGYGNDAVESEIRQFIGGLNEEEYRNLLALMWIGRGDYDKSEWDTALAEADRLGNDFNPGFFIRNPLLAEHIEDALNQFGYVCERENAARI